MYEVKRFFCLHKSSNILLHQKWEGKRTVTSELHDLAWHVNWHFGGRNIRRDIFGGHCFWNRWINLSVQRPFIQSCRMPLSHVFIPVTYTKTWTSENFSRTVFPKTAEVNYSLEEYLVVEVVTDWEQFNGWHKRQWLSSLRDKNGMYVFFSNRKNICFWLGKTKGKITDKCVTFLNQTTTKNCITSNLR